MPTSDLLDHHVAVVSGPVSEEDALYLREGDQEHSSLRALLDSLHRSGIRADHLDPTSPTFVADVAAYDVAFLNVHGRYGEDGRIQGLLDYLAIPYVNSGVTASAVGMDKLVTKAVFEFLDIPTPATDLVDGAPTTSLEQLPYMLKASDGGSSVGLELVSDRATASAALGRIRGRGFDRVFAEAYVPGRSVTVGVVEIEGKPHVLPPLETVSDRPFYDEVAKLSGEAGTNYREADDLPEDVLSLMGLQSERIFTFLDCHGAIRVDFMVTDDAAYALEINTAPGLQPHSNLPTAAEIAGIDYDHLVLALLENACERANPLPWAVDA